MGLPQLTARLVATGNAISFWITTSASILFVEKIGRRPLLMVTAGVMAVAFSGVSIGVAMGLAAPENHLPGIVATVFIWLYFTAFSSGWISIPWLYPAEVCYTKVSWSAPHNLTILLGEFIEVPNERSSAGDCLRLVGKLRNPPSLYLDPLDADCVQIVVQTTPPGMHHLKWGLYLIYAVLNAAFVPLVYYCESHHLQRAEFFLAMLMLVYLQSLSKPGVEVSSRPTNGSQPTQGGSLTKPITPSYRRRTTLTANRSAEWASPMITKR